MPGRLDGKVAAITGGTSGIGEATARKFVAEGASVVIAGRSVAKGERIANELGPPCAYKETDVLHEAQIAGLVDFTVATYGRLDCMFNNAGVGRPVTFESVTPDDFDASYRLLVGSVVFGIKH